MRYEEMANDLTGVIERKTGYTWPVEVVNDLIEVAVREFEDTRGYTPNTNYDGPEKFWVEDNALERFGVDPDWREGGY